MQQYLSGMLYVTHGQFTRDNRYFGLLGAMSQGFKPVSL